jgi:hypothetical protein
VQLDVTCEHLNPADGAAPNALAAATCVWQVVDVDERSLTGYRDGMWRYTGQGRSRRYWTVSAVYGVRRQVGVESSGDWKREREF